MRTLSKLSLIAAAALTTATAFADLTDVHPSGNPTPNTESLGVSGDGLTSFGITYGAGVPRAFKLVGTSLTQLDNLPFGNYSFALAASANGLKIVGYADNNLGVERAVLWNGIAATMIENGGSFASSQATSISSDGLVIAGYGVNGVNGLEEAFHYSGGFLTNFGNTEFAGLASKASGISADGTIVVGSIADYFVSPYTTTVSGFIYTISVGSSGPLYADSAIAAFSAANLGFTQMTGISGDGTVAIGFASSTLSSATDEQAFKYTLAGGGSYVALGNLGGWSVPRAISNDGSVIVGQSLNGSSRYEAFKYENGTISGLGFLTGGTVSNATGVSADGSVIVGYAEVAGGDIHSFVYANQTMLDADEWLRSLNGPGSLVAMSTNLNLLPLEGAHHRPLMSYDSMGKQSQAWATGDFGTSARQIDQHKTSGEIGVSSTFGGFVVGVAAGHASLNQDLRFGGNAHISGNYLLAEADYRLADKESILSLVLVRGDWDAEANRGYETGGGTDVSNGRTDLTTSSVRLRLDGPAQKFVNAVSATPFASFTLTRTTADAYTETTGSFPASFGDQAHTAQEGRLGLTAKYAASPSTTLLFTAEWIHRFDGAGDGLTATSSTMGTLTAAGIAPTSDQARFGFEVDHKLSADTLLNVSVHAAGNGPSSDFAGAISIRRAF